MKSLAAKLQIFACARSGASAARRFSLMTIFVWAFALAVTQAHSRNLNLEIVPGFHDVPLYFEKLVLTNSSGQTFSVTRLDFLVSDVALRDENGTWTEAGNQFAYLSLGGGRSAFTLTNLSQGNFDRLRFHIGVAPDLNHTNPAVFSATHPLDPNVNGLHWSWAGGYIFLATEGHWLNDKNENNGFSFHLANDATLMKVEIPVAIDLSRSESLRLAMNLNEFFDFKITDDNSSTYSRSNDNFAQTLRKKIEQSFSVSEKSFAVSNRVELSRKANVQIAAKATPYPFTISVFFPLPDLPRDNPLTEEGVELGRKLFKEKLLSRDGSQSCASCHGEQNAFSDTRAFSVGVDGQVGTRNAMPLMNLAWKKSFFWDGRAATLREQVLLPIENPIEMHAALTNVVSTLNDAKKSVNYAQLFDAAFGSPDITTNKISLALEQFLLTQVSFDSKFDRSLAGKETLTEEEKRGFQVFSTEYDPAHGQFGADCFHCHGAPLFQSQTFANNGLDSIFKDAGRFDATKKESDLGKFSVPSLRNVAVTAPYMHDGRFKTLEETVEHYATSVNRSATLDPNLAKHPKGGVPLDARDKQALVAFLRTLTDQRFELKEELSSK